MPVREPLMIEAQLMQYGRMQIVDTDRILGHLIAPRVAFTIDCAAADAAASQPARKNKPARGDRDRAPPQTVQRDYGRIRSSRRRASRRACHVF